MNRPLSPRTLKAYQDVLALAFGVRLGGFREQDQYPLLYQLDNLDTKRISTWGNSALNQLKCAVRWWRKSEGLNPHDPEIEKALAPRYQVEKQVYTPSEFEMEALEKAAQIQLPQAKAAVLLILYLGLRVEEFYMLTRKQVERGVTTKLLTFKRKGGREASLDVTKVTPLLDDLLLMPARQERTVKVTTARPKKWETVGQVYSSGQPKSQYMVIRRMVSATCVAAGLGKLSPHKLRHAFATRMNRDGASPFIIQAALNHKNIATTQRYVHAGSADVAKFMRGPGEKK